MLYLQGKYTCKYKKRKQIDLKKASEDNVAKNRDPQKYLFCKQDSSTGALLFMEYL